MKGKIDYSLPHGLLFDLDGVLVDSEGIYTEFWEDIDAIYPTGVKDFAHIIKGSTLDRILGTYFPKEQHPAILERLRRQEEEMVYRLFPGTLEYLVAMHECGWRVAIVTSSNMKKMDNLFRQIPELRPHIDVLVTDADVTRSKPDPQGYLIAAEKLGCRPENCIVFEDSISGLKAGRRAGAIVVGVATTNSREDVAPIADYVVDHTVDFNTDILK